MPTPYDYTIGEVASPQQSFLQGIQMVDALRKREQDQAAAIEAQRKQQELQALYAEALKPGAKPEVFQQLSFAIDPKQAALSRMQQLNDAQRQAAIQNIGSVWHPLLNGNNELALQNAKEQLAATQNSNTPDPSAIQRLQGIIKSIETTPELAQVSLATGLYGMGKEGEDFVKNTLAAFKGPVEQREAAAKAKKADADAIIAEAQAKFAPDKFGAELNLTNEQIAAAKSARRASEAAASASGAAAKRANAEAEQISSGIIPAEKRQDAETKFRKEYSDQTKGYQEVKSAYGRVLASEDNAVGDLSLIFGYMKMLDPGSVVREGEFATAQNAAGVPERIKNVYNQVISGERLSESQRSAFKGQAKKLYGTSQQQEAQVRQGISRIAKGYGLNTQNIFYTASEVEPIAPKESTPSAQPSNYQNMSDAELMKMLGR